MFVRRRRRGDHAYHELVESRREPGGKVRQRVVAYLGASPTLEDALRDLGAALAKAQQVAEAAERRADELVAATEAGRSADLPLFGPTDDPVTLRRVASYFSEHEVPAARRDTARLQVRLDKLRALHGPAERKSQTSP